MNRLQNQTPVEYPVSLTLNGKPWSANIDARTLLVELIREGAGLTGTHQGCDTSQCGACVVHFNGNSVKSCTMLALQADGGRVDTVESLGREDDLHPLQQAFTECHALQCGYCTPGMLMSGLDLLSKHPDADEQAIREGLDGNLCRCTGYNNIVKAIGQAALALQREKADQGGRAHESL